MCLCIIWAWFLFSPLAKDKTVPLKHNLKYASIKVPKNLPREIKLKPLSPLPKVIQDAKIVISKSQRRLSLYSAEKLLRIYSIGLGFNPDGDKHIEGDGATPEGEFYIFTKNPKSAYYLSLGISYPNKEDAERGLKEGLISKNQYQKIITAHKNKATPPQYTALGGLIYIHGGGSELNWTFGCVALTNENMKELFDVITVGTSVVITK